MIERCDICGHEKAVGRCWRLTCPTNGASPETLDLVRDDMRRHGIGIMKDGKRIDPGDFYAAPPEEGSLV